MIASGPIQKCSIHLVCTYDLGPLKINTQKHADFCAQKKYQICIDVSLKNDKLFTIPVSTL